MPEETKEPRKVTAIIESAVPRVPSKGGTRIHVGISFPADGAGELFLSLVNQLRNPLEVTFAEPMQLRLPDAGKNKAKIEAVPPPETETIKTTVDGAEAEVTRPRRASRVSNATAERLAALEAAGNTKHGFEPHNEDEFCAKCGKPTEASVHALPTWTERYDFHLANQGASSEGFPPNAADEADADENNGVCQPKSAREYTIAARARHEIPHGEPLKEPHVYEGRPDRAVCVLCDFQEGAGEHISAVAQELIEESRRTPATEAEAVEQERAIADLARAGK